MTISTLPNALSDPTLVAIPFLPEPAYQYVAKNGYTILIVPKQGGVFNISTWVQTGSIHENETNNGVSHFLEHLMFKGTERFKPGEFDRAMESMGAIINAATWKDFTFYYITGPQGSKPEDALVSKNFATALDMHADMLVFSTLPEAEIGPQYDPEDPNYKGEKRERAVVIEEIGMREDQPWTKVYNSVNHMMYPDGHPYRRDVIGTRQIVGNIPRAAIREYYRQWYSPKNMTTIVVGDFNPKDVAPLVLEAFNFSKLPADVPEGKALEQPATGNRAEGKRFEKIVGDYQTSFFIIGFHGPKPSNLKESIALDVFSYVLGEGRSSRLTQALLEKPEKPVFTTVGCDQTAFKLGNVFYIQGNYTDLTDQEALAQVKAELENLLTAEPITQDECQRALKKLKMDFASTSETASGIADALGESTTLVGDISHYTQYLDALATMDVDTVRSVAKQYLTFDQAYTTVMVPANVN
jgi:zinc protease